jgi:hypothetical protein
MKRIKLLASVGLLIIAGGSIWALPFIPGTAFYSKRVAKDVVSNMLADPSSAQFRNIVTGSDKISRNNLVCGEVNGRNGFGA